MARIRGTSGLDDLFGFEANDVIMCGAGDDFGSGGGGDDRINGSLGNDDLFGGDGSDRLLGGAGNDTLEDTIDWENLAWNRDELRGGNGDDFIFGGLGGDLHVGGKGNDYISLISGIAYGDESGAQRVFGNDTITTDLSLNYGVSRTMTGGLGQDTFLIYLRTGSGVPTQVDILDYTQGQDALGIVFPGDPAAGQWVSPVDAFERLDSNDDGRVDATDPATAFGSAGIENGNDLVLTVGLGDRIVLHDVTAWARDFEL